MFRTFLASTVIALGGVALAQNIAIDTGIIPPGFDIDVKNSHRVRDEAPAITKGSTGVVTPPITYHNGPLMTGTPHVYYIWYGNWNQSNGSDNAGGVAILTDFANSIGSSPYFQINTTYTTSTQTVTGNVSYVRSTTDAYSQGTRLKDSAILAVIGRAIGNGGLPYDAAGMYFVLTSSDVNLTSGFCTKYCGWHTSGTTNYGKVRYAFVGNASRCLSACAAQSVGPNGNAGVDGMVSVVAHELEEAVTDPDPRSGWADSNGAENADKCAWTFGQTLNLLPNGSYYNITLGARNFLIQRNLSHAASGDTCRVDATHQ